MADIILKDNQGIEQTYSGVKELNVLLADGTEQAFIAGEAVEKTVNLDFSSGENMVVVPDTGKFFEKVTIIKPASLVESNIAKDVDVAGVIGTHEGGDNETARVEYTYDDSGNIVAASFVNIKSILSYEMRAQKNLTAVDFSRSPNLTLIDENAFEYCSALKSINIPEPVSQIEIFAFRDCTALTSITLPKTLTKISSSVFQGCNATTSVYYEGSFEEWLSIKLSASPVKKNCSFYIDGELLSGKVVIPNTFTSIGGYVFCYTAITDVEIPDTVTSIGGYAFYGSGLTTVEIPDTVTSIGGYAFHSCSELTSAIVGSGITSFGNYVFRDCDSLSSVTLKEGLTTIGYGMFYACDALTSITIPTSVTEIGQYAFNYCKGLKSIKIPANVTKIGSYAFGSSTLSSVTDGGSTGWYVSTSSSATSGTSVSLTAYNLTTKYRNYYWFRKTT